MRRVYSSFFQKTFHTEHLSIFAEIASQTRPVQSTYVNPLSYSQTHKTHTTDSPFIVFSLLSEDQWYCLASINSHQSWWAL